MDTGKQWHRGGSAKSIGDILQRLTHTVAPSTAARSGDGSVQRVRAFLADGGAVRALAGSTPFEAVDRLLTLAGFQNKAQNQRLMWSRLLAHRLGREAPAVTLALLADVVADGTAISVGGCLGYRLRCIAAGKPRDGFSGRAPAELLLFLQQAFKNRQA
mgnify:CR=1 FL=1